MEYLLLLSLNHVYMMNGNNNKTFNNQLYFVKKHTSCIISENYTLLAYPIQI